MGWFSAIVLLAVIWFMTFFVVLPLRLKTQGEAGEIVPGTPGSAPEGLALKRKVILTSIIAVVVWAAIVAVVVSGVVTIDDIDLFTRFGGQLY